MVLFAYFLILLFGILIPFLIIIFFIFEFKARIMGAPYVPTKTKMVQEILKEAKLKKGQIFIEPGCGDGRVTRMAAEDYGVKAIGFDVNLFLILYARMISWINKIPNTEFRVENLFKYDFSQANVVFLFLLPETLEKLANKLKKECQKNTLVISHGFKIKGMEKDLSFTIQRKIFPTYFYKI